MNRLLSIKTELLMAFGLLCICLSFLSFCAPEWGFFGHKKINRMAVFTLPPEMIQFYKKNIEYITAHSIDPDKRRYATRHEAVRHYIDIDSWGDNPFSTVPRIFEDALIKYSHFYAIKGLDSTRIQIEYSRDSVVLLKMNQEKAFVKTSVMRRWFRDHVMPQYYEDQWTVNGDSSDFLRDTLNLDLDKLYIEDHFSKEGILPYHLLSMYYKLRSAFENEDKAKILRVSAEFGHYIGDAHVPLHTTKNYNGQLSDQVGIHAFWESRLPELFANKEYSFLVGRANYVDRPLSYFWDMVYQSHLLLDDVLEYERELKKVFPEDQQLCYDERLSQTIKTQCPEFAEAYHVKLNGMVERRMQDAILAIGSIWYTAWVDAGQPDLNNLEEVDIVEEVIQKDPNVKTRDHGF